MQALFVLGSGEGRSSCSAARSWKSPAPGIDPTYANNRLVSLTGAGQANYDVRGAAAGRLVADQVALRGKLTGIPPIWGGKLD